MDDKIYSIIKEKAKEASKLNGACKKGYHDLLCANTIGHFCYVIDKYWKDIIGMHRLSTFSILEELYEKYKNDFNLYGIYYNENCTNGKVIVNGASIVVDENAVAWVYNHGVIQAKGCSKVYLYDNSEAYISEKAEVFAYDNTKVQANGNTYVRAFANSKVFLDGEVEAQCGESCEVVAYRWRKIMAAGDSKIFACCRRNVKLFDNAILLQL